MKIGNRLLLSLFLLLVGALSALQAQDKSQRPSPPAEAGATFGDLTISINYGSPAVKGRQIWGKLVPYGQVWRTGANEATTFTVNQDVLVEGQLLRAGKYALFTIPGENEWTVIFNKDAAQWGAYNYDKSKDVLRFTVKPSKVDALQERLTFDVKPLGDAATVIFTWEKLTFGFAVKKA